MVKSYRCDKCLKIKSQSEFKISTEVKEVVCVDCQNKAIPKQYKYPNPDDYLTLFIGEDNWYGAYFG